MKLIIDIQDFVYNHIKEFNSTQLYELNVISAIKSGILLSEELEKIRVEIKEKIEQEEFARSVFRHEEKDTVKAEQCTGSIMAYKNVIILFDKYKAESEELKEENKQIRCNTCQNNTDELSGECYECVKGIEDWYEPISELKGENK